MCPIFSVSIIDTWKQKWTTLILHIIAHGCHTTSNSIFCSIATPTEVRGTVFEFLFSTLFSSKQFELLIQSMIYGNLMSFQWVLSRLKRGRQKKPESKQTSGYFQNSWFRFFFRIFNYGELNIPSTKITSRGQKDSSTERKKMESDKWRSFWTRVWDSGMDQVLRKEQETGYYNHYDRLLLSRQFSSSSHVGR